MSGRLTVRFSPIYQRWIESLGGDQAEAVRALMTLRAVALGLPDAEYEADGLLRADLPAYVKAALLMAADRQRPDRQAVDKRQITATVEEIEPAEEPEIDPFMAAGIAV